MTLKQLTKAYYQGHRGYFEPVLIGLGWSDLKAFKTMVIEPWHTEEQKRTIRKSRTIFFKGVLVVYSRDLRRGQVRVWDYKLQPKDVNVQ